MSQSYPNWSRRDFQSVWHPFSPVPSQGPRALFTHAKGAYVYTEDGKKLFDATASWWCITHGHCHERLVKALTATAGKLDQVLFAPHTHPLALELSERILKLLGAPLSKVFFSDDGSTSVEAAIKMALQYHLQRLDARSEFISIGLGYHGDTLGACALGGIDTYHEGFRGIIASRRLLPPYCFRCPVNEVYPQCDVKCAADLSIISSKTAAVVIEPLILGAAGMVVYPSEYVERLVKRARSVGALVIFDEVFTGFGRTGKMFASDHLEARPDIICLSKGLTAGMLPMALTVTTDEIYHAFCGAPDKAFYHGHTFTGNALGCAVALESLKIFEDDQVLESNRQKSEVLREAFERMRGEAFVGDVRGMGMVWAVECVKSGTKEGLPTSTLWDAASKLWELGVFVRPLHSTIYLVPPYCTTASELRWVAGQLHDTLGRLEVT